MDANAPAAPQSFTRDDPRCIEVERRLADARAQMIARGTPLLLYDRPAWRRVTPHLAVVTKGGDRARS